MNEYQLASYYASRLVYKGFVECPNGNISIKAFDTIAVNIGYYVIGGNNEFNAISNKKGKKWKNMAIPKNEDVPKYDLTGVIVQIKSILDGSYTGLTCMLVSPAKKSLDADLIAIVNDEILIKNGAIASNYVPQLPGGEFKFRAGNAGLEELYREQSGLISVTAEDGKRCLAVSVKDNGNILYSIPLTDELIKKQDQFWTNDLSPKDIQFLETTNRFPTKIERVEYAAEDMTDYLAKKLVGREPEEKGKAPAGNDDPESSDDDTDSDDSDDSDDEEKKPKPGAAEAEKKKKEKKKKLKRETDDKLLKLLASIDKKIKSDITTDIDLTESKGNYKAALKMMDAFEMTDEELLDALTAISLAPKDDYQLDTMIKNAMALLVENGICEKKDANKWFIKVAISLSKGGFSKNADYTKVFEQQGALAGMSKEKAAALGKLLNKLKITPSGDAKNAVPTLSRWAESFYYILASKKVQESKNIMKLVNIPAVWAKNGYTDDNMFSIGFELQGSTLAYWSNLGTTIRIQMRSLDRIKKETKLIGLIVSSIRKRNAIQNQMNINFTLSNGQNINPWDFDNPESLKSLLPELEQGYFLHGFNYKNFQNYTIDQIVEFLKADSDKIDKPEVKK